MVAEGEDERIRGRRICLLQPVKVMKGALRISWSSKAHAKAGFVARVDVDGQNDPLARRDDGINNPLTMTNCRICGAVP